MDRWIELAINGLLFFLFLGTFVSQLSLLYKSTQVARSERLSLPILNNITYWVVLSFFGFVQSANVCLYPLNQRNFYLSYIIGLPFGGLAAPIALSISFLLLDRIFALTLHVHYRKYRAQFVTATVVSCISVFMFVMLSLYFDYNIFKPKTKFGFNLYGGYFVFVSVRVIIGILNAALSILLIILLNRYSTNNNNSNRQFKKANSLAIFAAFFEFICNFVPNFVIFIYFYFQMRTGEWLFNFPMVLTGIDAITTALIYRFVIKKKQRSNKVLTTTTVFKSVPLGPIVFFVNKK